MRQKMNFEKYIPIDAREPVKSNQNALIDCDGDMLAEAVASTDIIGDGANVQIVESLIVWRKSNSPTRRLKALNDMKAAPHIPTAPEEAKIRLTRRLRDNPRKHRRIAKRLQSIEGGQAALVTGNDNPLSRRAEAPPL